MSAPRTINGIALPTRTDAASVTSYLTTLVAGIISVITLAHPGFTEPSVVPALVPAVSLVIAGGAQLFNIIRHAWVTVAALASGCSLDKPSS